MVRVGGGASWSIARRIAVWRAKAWQCDGRRSALHRNSRHSRRTACSAACSARTWVRRDSAASIRVRASTCRSASRARPLARKSAPRAVPAADAVSSAAAPKSALGGTFGRHGDRASTGSIRQSDLRSGLARDHNSISSGVAIVARRRNGRTQVERVSRSAAFVAATVAG